MFLIGFLSGLFVVSLLINRVIKHFLVKADKPAKWSYSVNVAFAVLLNTITAGPGYGWTELIIFSFWYSVVTGLVFFIDKCVEKFRTSNE